MVLCFAFGGNLYSAFVSLQLCVRVIYFDGLIFKGWHSQAPQLCCQDTQWSKALRMTCWGLGGIEKRLNLYLLTKFHQFSCVTQSNLSTGLGGYGLMAFLGLKLIAFQGLLQYLKCWAPSTEEKRKLHVSVVLTITLSRHELCLEQSTDSKLSLCSLSVINI